MPGLIVVGAQWGDEGKGRIVDLLAADVQMVVRYQGGSNAGHTVVREGRTVRLHQVPSGIMRPGVLCVIGNGTVVEPFSLLEEMDELAGFGCDLEVLRISRAAHLLLPYHQVLDQVQETSRGTQALGTTGRGIGPAYTDKAARVGIRVEEMLRFDAFARHFRVVAQEKNRLLVDLYGQPPLDIEAMLERLRPAAERLAPHIADTSLIVHQALRRGDRVLFEGAQGTLLDIDHGTYPFVTSSNPTAGGACVGTGMAPGEVGGVLGIAKAYTTRVGSGPFPTECRDEVGEHLVREGVEYGATTGRRRRCGWLDVVLLRYAARLNGFTSLAVTKLDVLTGLPRLRICTAYRCGGTVAEDWPPIGYSLADCEPVYEEWPGWSESLREARRWEDLPEAARRYVERMEELVGLPADLVSVGPEREQLIVRRSPWRT
ncbi:MAG: adenylosuccinate synthase [Anaerolineae bacterium]|nr:adenylosuccinate synthase [Anaerolineae bacterium]